MKEMTNYIITGILITILYSCSENKYPENISVAEKITQVEEILYKYGYSFEDYEITDGEELLKLDIVEFEELLKHIADSAEKSRLQAYRDSIRISKIVEKLKKAESVDEFNRILDEHNVPKSENERVIKH